MKILAALTLVALIASPTIAQYKGAKPAAKERAVGFKSINPADCKKWLSVLASDDFGGRGTGTEGYQKAADFMAARFEEFGLEPAGDDGTWFQNVPFKRSRLDPEKSGISIEGGNFALAVGEELSLSGSDGEVSAEVVFVNPKHGALGDSDIDDRSALRGKIVIVGAGRGELRGAALLSDLRGARATFYTTDKKITSDGRWRVTRGGGRSRRGGRRIGGNISREASRRLAKALGVNAKYAKKQKGKGSTLMHASGKEVTLTLVNQTEDIGVPNVLGMLKGSDPELADQVVIMGSHLDHIGTTADGQINNGADDDGSGSTALLAVARAFAKNGVRPKRTLVFIAVCGEEMGLIGSAYYCNNPLFPIENTVAELQMDMVGRNEESRNEKPSENIRTMHLVGSKRLSKELHQIVLDANKKVNFEFEYDEEGVYTRSDHYNFAKKGIPIVFVFSGFHPDYHRPTDTIEKINFVKIANTARLIYLTAFEVAQRQERIKVDSGPLKSED